MHTYLNAYACLCIHTYIHTYIPTYQVFFRALQNICHKNHHCFPGLPFIPCICLVHMCHYKSNHEVCKEEIDYWHLVFHSDPLSLPGPCFLHLWPGRIGPGRFKGSFLLWPTTQVPQMELILLLVSWNTFLIGLSVAFFCMYLFHFCNNTPTTRTTRTFCNILYLFMRSSNFTLLTPPAILNHVYNSFLCSFTTCMHSLRAYYFVLSVF